MRACTISKVAKGMGVVLKVLHMGVILQKSCIFGVIGWNWNAYGATLKVMHMGVMGMILKFNPTWKWWDDILSHAYGNVYDTKSHAGI